MTKAEALILILCGLGVYTWFAVKRALAAPLDEPCSDYDYPKHWGVPEDGSRGRLK